MSPQKIRKHLRKLLWEHYAEQETRLLSIPDAELVAMWERAEAGETVRLWAVPS